MQNIYTFYLYIIFRPLLFVEFVILPLNCLFKWGEKSPVRAMTIKVEISF